MAYPMRSIADTLLLSCLILSPLVLSGGFIYKKYAVVASTPCYDELFVGTIEHNPLSGKAKVFVEAKVSDVQCQGVSKAPASLSIKGLRGEMEMTCTDGRKLKGQWEALSISGGKGSGFDNLGNPFRFAFAKSVDEAESELVKFPLANSGQHPGE